MRIRGLTGVSVGVVLGFVLAFCPVDARAQAIGYQPIIGQVPDGAFMNVTPVVSADRRYVRLGVNAAFYGFEGFQSFSFPTGAVSGGGFGGGGFGGGGFGGGGFGGGGVAVGFGDGGFGGGEIAPGVGAGLAEIRNPIGGASQQVSSKGVGPAWVGGGSNDPLYAKFLSASQAGTTATPRTDGRRAAVRRRGR